MPPPKEPTELPARVLLLTVSVPALTNSSLPHPKEGRLPSGVGGRDTSANRRRGQSRTVGGTARVLAGAALATEVISGAGSAAVTSRWTPRPMGPTACLLKARCPMLEPYALKG